MKMEKAIRSLFVSLIQLKQMNMLQQTKAKTAAIPISSDTGWNALKDFTASNKRMHHPQEATISVWQLKMTKKQILATKVTIV